METIEKGVIPYEKEFENTKLLKSEIISLLEQTEQLQEKLDNLNPQNISQSTLEESLISIGYDL